MRISARVLLAGVLCTAACSTSAQMPNSAGPATVVAMVGSSPITLADVDEHGLDRPAADFGSLRLSQALYEARRSALDGIIGNMLFDAEAKSRGIDRAALIAKEISAKVETPTEAEINEWYQANPARVQGAALDQVRAPIRQLLTERRTQVAREAFLDMLRKKTPVKIALDPPRQKIADAGRPSRGPATAKVEVVEFSDFQCPYCGRAYPVVGQVLKAYGDKIHFVYRHYPLSNHPNARPAAEAAACAAEQGKFWEFHNRLFEHQDKLSDTDLKEAAIALGLEMGTFTTCVNTRKYQKDVDADIAAANEVGVTGTPAFFINGRPLEGAQPFDAFKTVIDEELAR